LRNNYYQKIEKLQELKQSILHKAFTGELWIIYIRNGLGEYKRLEKTIVKNYK
jgi:hypothetical protein